MVPRVRDSPWMDTHRGQATKEGWFWGSEDIGADWGKKLPDFAPGRIRTRVGHVRGPDYKI